MLLGATPRLVSAQAREERGAIALGEAVMGLGVNTRVLMIGAHPDDEDTNLIAWLSRGRYVRTGYLSLTRGDGGQNLIGNELGEALGVIRTEELLAARRIDGGEQYFTRAFDFGFSKDTIDTYKHWPKDSILGDVVRVIRAMKPHVIIAVFSGTTRDGHGQHQVSGLLAREAYDLAGDTVRFPTAIYGGPWTPLKFYRAARFNPQQGTLSMDVGEYSPLLGRSYAEIAGESRSQHKSQGFGAPQRKGRVLDYLRREATRVNAPTPADSEKTLFDGIDTSWARFRTQVDGARRDALDSLPGALAAAAASFDAFAPARSIRPLGRVQRLVAALGDPSDADFLTSVGGLRSRIWWALTVAANVEADALAPRPIAAIGKETRLVVTVHNRGRDTIDVITKIPPGGTRIDTMPRRFDQVTQPDWLAEPRVGALFAIEPSPVSETRRSNRKGVSVGIEAQGAEFQFHEPYVFRTVDAVAGEIRHLVAAVPAITVTLDASRQYAPANTPLDRRFEVRLTSADSAPRTAEVILQLPDGLTADGTNRVAILSGYGATAVLTFHVRGRLPRGEHRLSVVVESAGETFTTGYTLIDYEHIEPQRIYRPATIDLSAVDVRVPATLRVVYVPGVSDNVAPALEQLGVPVTIVHPREIATANLTRFTTLVLGPRAYEAHPELVASAAKILEFARRGGTVVVQYGQYEMTQPGIMPFPITINRPHDRVTHEDAPVTLLDSTAREISWPNRIRAADFDAWVQERSLYMPRTFDPNYRPLLAMSDPGEAANRGAVLVANVGRGRYVYTSMAFFRQLPAGVPGAARLFVNLLSAGLPRTP